MGNIKKAVIFAMYMAVVYHALSSHDEKPVMVSRPTKELEEARALAAALEASLDDGYRVEVLGIKGGQGLEAIFDSLERMKKPQNQSKETEALDMG